MADRLFVGVLGNRDSGKSSTWNELFGREVRRGKQPRDLELRVGECAEVFLVSGSFEEREEYAGDILKNQNCRIILCSIQYTEKVQDTLDYIVEQGFDIWVQWLNPGYKDSVAYWDRLGLANRILSYQGILSIRDGQDDLKGRVQEIREHIYGWASYRSLVKQC